MPGRYPTLEPFYYLDHFEEMLAFLEKNCAALLGEEESSFIRDFRELPKEGRALVVRLANRSGTVFKTSALKYKELPDLGQAVVDMVKSGFARAASSDDGMCVAGKLTRAEILVLLRPVKFLSSKSKAELLEMLPRHIAPMGLPAEILERFLVQERVETLEFLFFVFFGKYRRGLKALALRDLGIVKTRSGQSSFEVRFPSRIAATDSFFYAKAAERISASREDGLGSLAEELPDWPQCGDAANASIRDREICRLGARLEQAGFPGEALGVYRHACAHPARERMCRILFSKGETDVAKRMLLEMTENPTTDGELLFAEDFHARKFGGRKVGRLTSLLRAAPVIEIDEAFRDSPEEAAAKHFTKRGERAFRTENHLWSSLFGLMFWDLLQGENGETKHNEFEHRPTQLTDGSFLKANGGAISRQLAMLHDGTAMSHLGKMAEVHMGEANGVFRWKRDLLAPIRELLAHGAPDAIEKVLRRICKEPGHNGIGFPDLMVVSETGLRFVEVKAEGDQIRSHQLVQLQALEKAGFTVEVVRVEWFADPEQEYVVVDIETTGGRAANHRVTEIGAVRVCKGEVVGKFSTLVNPGRRIPGNITRLTGISDQMVAGAPGFGGVAQAFREFVGDAIFVAHSAPFDYGFLRAEFARLGEDFRRPTLCTVVAMRKFFPGLPSYRLAGLAEYFGIPLESHHRALCDAEATAELLKLIVEKRMAGR